MSDHTPSGRDEAPTGQNDTGSLPAEGDEPTESTRELKGDGKPNLHWLFRARLAAGTEAER
jgi:hypothetical protein